MVAVHFTFFRRKRIQPKGDRVMKSYTYFVGIDISSADFTVAIFKTPDINMPSHTFSNCINGFEGFQQWLKASHIQQDNSLICMEATGVYSEALSYWLYAKGFSVVVEMPLKVKRAFKIKGHKTDSVDALQIAEYAWRFNDQLVLWQPKSQIIEQLRTLLTTREQLLGQKVAFTNALKALQRKPVHSKLATACLETNIQHFINQIDEIETEMRRLIDQDPKLKHLANILFTIPGVKLLLTANLIVLTNGFSKTVTYKKMAALLGICPYQYQSGTSVIKRPKSSGYGCHRIRKLLHLAARCNVTHNPKFMTYYQLKLAEGKPKRLVLNNVANRLIRIICAMVRDQKVFLKNHVTVNPKLFVCA